MTARPDISETSNVARLPAYLPAGLHTASLEYELLFSINSEATRQYTDVADVADAVAAFGQEQAGRRSAAQVRG